MLYSPPIDDHGALGGLSDDDHSIYVLLAGRTGGQTIVGGSTGLRLQSGGTNQDVTITPNGTGKVDVVGHARFGLTSGTQVYVGSAGSNHGFVGFNAVPQTGGTYQYAVVDYASIIQFLSGGFRMKTAASGSIGGTITFTDRVIVTQAGLVCIGGTTPNYQLEVGGAIGATWTSYSNAYKALMTPSIMGYSSTYKTVVLGSSSTGTGNNQSVTFAFNYDPVVNAGGSFSGDGREIIFRRGQQFCTPNAGNTNWYNLNLCLYDGMVGVGTATPTAFVDASASTTSAASVRMRAGSAPTSPNEGDHWVESGLKNRGTFLAGIKQYSHNVLFSGASAKNVYSTTSETSLLSTSGSNVGSATLPANFWTVGKVVEVEVNGYLTTSGSPGSMVVAFKVGSTVTLTTASITPPANIGSPSAYEGQFRIWVRMICYSTGASGSFRIFGELEFYETGGAVSNTKHHYSLLDATGSVFTIDTTASKALDVVVQFGSTNEAMYSEIQTVKVVG